MEIFSTGEHRAIQSGGVVIYSLGVFDNILQFYHIYTFINDNVEERVDPGDFVMIIYLYVTLRE